MLAVLKALVQIDGIEGAKKGLASLDAGMEKAAKTAGGALHAGFAKAGEGIKKLGEIAAQSVAVVAGATSLVGTAMTVVGTETALKMDSLTRGLATVAYNAKDLTGQLERLKEVAKLPGLGFEEAVQGSLLLQSAGLSARSAEAALKGFGNALAMAGKGKAELTEIVNQFQQMVSNNKISNEDLRVIVPRAPAIGDAMKKAFGTTDGVKLEKMGIDPKQFIEKLSIELAKLPQILNSPQNAVENLQSGIKEALAPIGQGVLEMFVSMSVPIETAIAKMKGFATAVGEVLAAVGASGELAKAMSSLFGGDVDTSGVQDRLIKIAATVLTVVGNLRTAFQTLGYNIREVWDYISSVFVNIYEKAKIIFEYLIKAALAVAEKLADMFGPLIWVVEKLKDAVSSVLGNTDFGKRMAAVDAANPIKAPEFRKFDPVFAGYDAIAANIRRNVKPLESLPKDLSYRDAPTQKQAEEATSTIWAQWDKYLAGIEKNTAKTADMLTGRRVSGGGELAQMGVSGAEIRKVSANRNARLYGRA